MEGFCAAISFNHASSSMLNPSNNTLNGLKHLCIVIYRNNYTNVFHFNNQSIR